MANKLERWTRHGFSSSSYAGEDYLKFQQEAKTDLKKQAAAAGYKLFKFNKNHYCFSAVLQDEKMGSFFYVSVSDVRFNKNWYSEVLYRTMKHAKDWIGGTNHFCSWDEIAKTLSSMKEIRNTDMSIC